jgi:Uma2 family endonuclease
LAASRGIAFPAELLFTGFIAIAAPARRKMKRLWTYDQMVAQLPETNLPMELWDGEIIMSPTPTPSHQTMVLRFARILMDFTGKAKLGTAFISPLDVVLSPRRVVQPDVFFVSNARPEIIQDRIRGAPDLVVEVISQGTWRRDRIDKKALYEQAGVREYWIIDPESRTIEVFALADNVYQLHSKATDDEDAQSRLLPGFKTAFSDLER